MEGSCITLKVGSEATALALLGGFLERLPINATGEIALTAEATDKNVGDGVIDHIFVSDDVATVQLHQILTEQYVPEGSDHCPVIADIARK